MQGIVPDHTGRNAVDNSEELKERRKFNRLLTGDGIFAVCTTDSCIRLGKVVDVSRGGIAIQYLAFDAEDRDFTIGPVKLEVFDRRSLCCLKEAACSIVYDFQMPRGNSFLSSFQLRLCGVKFGELSNDQYSLLDSIIHHRGLLSDAGFGVHELFAWTEPQELQADPKETADTATPGGSLKTLPSTVRQPVPAAV
jgi:hypothetical protein